MPTIPKLAEDGALVQIDPVLESSVQKWRCLYGTPEFVQWLEDELPNLEKTVFSGEADPEEQVDDLFNQYVSGQPFSSDRRFKPLSYTPELFVWEFKTNDLRIFGWIPKKDFFICAFGRMKDDLELNNSYGRYIAQTEYVRNQLDLNEPKTIESREYDDVISTQNFPS